MATPTAVEESPVEASRPVGRVLCRGVSDLRRHAWRATCSAAETLAVLSVSGRISCRCAPDVPHVHQIPTTLGHALSVEDERDAFAESIARLSSSARAAELVRRLGEALELTDGLWELVPVVVADSQAHDQRPPAEVADRSPAGLALTDEERRRLREIADDFGCAMDTAGGVPDEAATARVTLTRVMTDPFGTLDTLFDMSAYGARVVSDPQFTRLTTELSSASADRLFYLVAYMQASIRSPRTPVFVRESLETRTEQLRK
jgi:hypothetical protein